MPMHLCCLITTQPRALFSAFFAPAHGLIRLLVFLSAATWLWQAIDYRLLVPVGGAQSWCPLFSIKMCVLKVRIGLGLDTWRAHCLVLYQVPRKGAGGVGTYRRAYASCCCTMRSSARPPDTYVRACMPLYRLGCPCPEASARGEVM